MSRTITVKCDVCGGKLDLYNWCYLPSRIAYPTMAYGIIDLCSVGCDKVFRAYFEHYKNNMKNRARLEIQTAIDLHDNPGGEVVNYGGASKLC